MNQNEIDATTWKHPHFEIIVAWASDTTKTLQYRMDEYSDWRDVMGTPVWNCTNQYRIKPEPKPDIIYEYVVSLGNDCMRVRYKEHWERPNVRFIFDGDTGDLKNIEVLK